MTLCLAWRFGHNVAFATDSIVGTSLGREFDVAIKLFAIPVLVRGSTDAVSGRSNVVYSRTIALSCSAENAAVATVFKDAFASICSNLQRLDERPNLPFREIVEVAVRIYEKVGAKARAGYEIKSLPDVLMGGWCDEQKRVRVFKLVAPREDTDTPIISERLLAPGPYDFQAIGSGTDAYCSLAVARRAEDGVSPLKMLRWFKEMIDSKKVESVGGTIQYGEFMEGDFRIRGIVYPPANETSRGARFILGTLDVEDLRAGSDELGLHITGNFADPFLDGPPSPAREFMRNIPEVPPG